MLSKSEPVRRWLYGLLAPVLAVLVAYGLVDGAEVALWIALGTAVLGVPAVEIARSQVTPVASQPKPPYAPEHAAQ